MLVHGLRVGMGHDDARANCPIRANRTEEIGPLIARIADGAGLVPLRAQSLVSVPFWPMRASSWNQISMGFVLACSGRLSLKILEKFA